MHAAIVNAASGLAIQRDGEPAVRLVERHEEARALATLTAAFVSDPPNRWLYPDAEDYLRCFPRFARAFGANAVGLGTAWCSEDLAACALWFPPGTGPDEAALAGLIEDTIVPARRQEVLAVFHAMGEAHPTEPHWYLPLIGVDIAHQGRGLGAAVLATTLARCDVESLPAYLEATSPRNVRFYERHGFRELAQLRIGDCPVITPMWREPGGRRITARPQGLA